MNYDSVTGLPSYEFFLDFAQKIRIARADSRFVLLSVNIASFHKVNQLYGYEQGNHLLSLLSQRMIRSLDYMLTACRTQADSFIILADIYQDSLTDFTDRVLTDFSTFTDYMKLLYPDAGLTLRGGISQLLPKDSSEEHALEHAIEHACFARKSLEDTPLCDNTMPIAFYHDALLLHNHRENLILPLFEDILINNHLILYLQPKFVLDTHEMIGAEALVRIMDSRGRLLKPASFLSVLEKYGLGIELDLMVAESVLRLLRSWEEAGFEAFPISINLSESDFTSKSFLSIFDEIMEKYAPYTQQLELELDSECFYDNPDYMTAVIEKLHSYGCKIHLDHFGRQQLAVNTFGIPPVDMVKFDRQLLTLAIKTPNNHYTLEKLTELFEACNVAVLCEGVENHDEELLLSSCGISYVQGFYYGRPLPIPIFEKKYMAYSIKKGSYA